MKTFDDPKLIACQNRLYTEYKNFLERQFPSIPSSEVVFLSYFCKHLKTSEHNKSKGRIFLTQNYVLYKSDDGAITLSIPMMLIQRVERKRSPKTGIYPGVVLYLSQGKEKHLIKNTPSFIEIPNKLNSPEESTHNEKELSKLSQSTPNVFSTEKKKDVDMYASQPFSKGRWAEFKKESLHDVTDYEKVDVKGAQDMAETANKILDLQINTRAKIEEQAGAIDRIDRNIQEMDNNVRSANHKVDKMGNLVSMGKGIIGDALHKDIAVYEAPDRTPGDIDPDQHMDFSVVIYDRRKMKIWMKNYAKGMLTIKKDEVIITKLPDTKTDENDDKVPQNTKDQVKYKFHYNEIVLIQLKLHSFYLCIRLSDCDIELCTSFTQPIVNELILRSKENIPVVFEDTGKKFDYGNTIIRTFNANGSTSGTYSSGFVRPSAKLSETVLSKVPREVKKDLKKQEDAIESAQAAVDLINKVTTETNTEFQRQNKQLHNIHDKVDDVSKRTKTVDRKVYNKT